MSTWPFGAAWCKIYHYSINVSAYASVYTLVLMSLDRYLAVVHPVLSLPFRTERNASIAVLATWLIIASLNAYIPFEYSVVEYPFGGELRSDCFNEKIFAELMVGSMTHARVLHGTFFALGYVVPLGTICALYGLMLRKFLYGVAPGQQQSVARVMSKRRVTRMVVLVVVVFAVCWLPIHGVFMAMYFFGWANGSSAWVTLQVITRVIHV